MFDFKRYKTEVYKIIGAAMTVHREMNYRNIIAWILLSMILLLNLNR